MIADFPFLKAFRCIFVQQEGEIARHVSKQESPLKLCVTADDRMNQVAVKAFIDDCSQAQGRKVKLFFSKRK
jgi:hypothetical protein